MEWWLRPLRYWLRLGLGASVAFWVLVAGEYVRVWTPLQRYYASWYLRSALYDRRLWLPPGGCWMVQAVDRRGVARLASDNLLTQETRTAYGRGQLPFGLVPGAQAAGWARLRVVKDGRPHPATRAILRREIYHVDSIWTFLARPVHATCLVAMMILAISATRRWHRYRLLRGQRLRGAEQVSPTRFNSLLGGDGIGFRVYRWRWPERWLWRWRLAVPSAWPQMTIRIPRAEESKHLLFQGGTGSGKTNAVGQLLQGVEEREEIAIVHDAGLEYTQAFFDEARGDIILNPFDVRSPYWLVGDEIDNPAEAVGLATALFHDEPGRNNFFVESAGTILGHLLLFGPTVEQLISWISNPEEIDRRVAGTALQAVISPNAPAQRQGVLGTLAKAVKALEHLPRREQATREWSVRSWVRRRQRRGGWIFLGSQPSTRGALMPVYSLWLDMLIVQSITSALVHEAALPVPIWFVLDELPALGRLPQLSMGLAEGRKAACHFVLGLQGHSQLQERYGEKAAEAMISQPATRVLLRASEPSAARWVRDSIGDVELERLTQTYAEDGSRTESTQRSVESRILSSEAHGLPCLEGHVVHANLVARVSMPVVRRARRAPAFEARPHQAELLSPMGVVEMENAPAPSPGLGLGRSASGTGMDQQPSTQGQSPGSAAPQPSIVQRPPRDVEGEKDQEPMTKERGDAERPQSMEAVVAKSAPKRSRTDSGPFFV